MTEVNISEAARIAGVNRSTIQRHLKDGKLSAMRDATGKTKIDIAELKRAFPGLKMPATDVQQADLLHLQQSAPSEFSELNLRNQQLETENLLLRELIREKDAHIKNLAAALDLLRTGKQNEQAGATKGGQLLWHQKIWPWGVMLIAGATILIGTFLLAS